MVTATSSSRAALPTRVYSTLDGELLNELSLRGEEEAAAAAEAESTGGDEAHGAQGGVTALAVRGSLVVTGDHAGRLVGRNYGDSLEFEGCLGDVGDDPLGWHTRVDWEGEGKLHSLQSRFWAM